MKPSESLKIDAFSMRIGDIKGVELDRLHALSLSVGCPHRAEDWQFLREVGQGFVALDEIGRVLGSAMWFAHGARFATVGMVITSREEPRNHPAGCEGSAGSRGLEH